MYLDEVQGLNFDLTRMQRQYRQSLPTCCHIACELLIKRSTDVGPHIYARRECRQGCVTSSMALLLDLMSVADPRVFPVISELRSSHAP